MPTTIVGLKTGNNWIRYRGRVAYDGSKFRGFQIQEGKKKKNEARTIQDTIEQVLRKRFDRQTIRVVGAGRTDAGVSSRGQAFHFDLTEKEHEKLVFQSPSVSLDYVMNRMLTDEIRVWNVGPAPPPRRKAKQKQEQKQQQKTDNGTTKKAVVLYAWNAIHDTTHKLYSYRFCLSSTGTMDPIYRFHRWQVDDSINNPVNITLLEQTLKQFEGMHDFRAFAGSIEQLEKKSSTSRKINTTRTIYNCDLVDETSYYNHNNNSDNCNNNDKVGVVGGRGGCYYRIDIVLSGALYKMVRNMVGTAIDVSRGRMEEETFLRLLRNNHNNNNQKVEEEVEGGEDRGPGSLGPPHHQLEQQQQRLLYRKDNKSKPAPPEGLCLERVFYEDDDIF